MERGEEDTTLLLKRHNTKEEMKSKNLVHITQGLGDASQRKEVDKVIENSVVYSSSKSKDIPIGNEKRGRGEFD